ncbi:TatD family hydrolase, partial [Candidatus Falkowbacteria bacterium]|nr:TatD family hydrolase [Candidatus Falkowbacteria bacterium]
MFIDTHTHLQSTEFDADRDQLISDCLGNEIWTVNIGTHFESSQQGVALAERYEDGVYATVGLHPDYASKYEFKKSEFENLIINSSK